MCVPCHDLPLGGAIDGGRNDGGRCQVAGDVPASAEWISCWTISRTDSRSGADTAAAVDEVDARCISVGGGHQGKVIRVQKSSYKSTHKSSRLSHPADNFTDHKATS